jgi:hypothetical protein
MVLLDCIPDDEHVRECSEFREWMRAAELSVATELRAGERRNLCVSSEALEEVGSGLYREGG